ncbi:UvrD-helicase domain-containing protein [Archangium violaceum]|uniref:UvrD-helicase domain-containing protein n=1 Tax=Archangium violaceum TaxID=83451 RepID=UPI001EF446A2|nr:DEAD/DEAH box helicase [Archangium violaceum]
MTSESGPARIPADLFWQMVSGVMGIDPSELRPIVQPGSGTPMQITAGAGTGKTTALTLKCLHAVYVEAVPPETIVATTFTKKAARELQSRILSRGQQLVRALRDHLPENAFERLRLIDLNLVRTGTLDSLVQGVLREYKTPRDPPPIPIEPFVARGLLLKEGLFARGRHNDDPLTDYLRRLRGRRWPVGLGSAEKARLLYELRFFCITSGVDTRRYLEQPDLHPGARVAFEALEDFERAMESLRIADYTRLSSLFLERLEKGALKEFARTLRLILVDEYQDTDHLQERIYFGLAAYARLNGGALVVVGDDDQALYRFRGATVGLFRDFVERFEHHFGQRPQRHPLVVNRRSTPEIIQYCQEFVTNDPGYMEGRTPKPPLVPPPGRLDSGVPVYLLVKDGKTAEPLAREVARVIRSVLSREGWSPTPGAEEVSIDHARGSASDIAIIAASAQERGNDNEPTFIGYLRNELDRLGGPPLFNPRGRDFTDVTGLRVLLGLLLEAFDPSGAHCATERLPRDIRDTFEQWRQDARAFTPSPPAHVRPGLHLHQYIESLRDARSSRAEGPRTLLVSEVIYRLVTWLPFFQDDLEGLAYLEVIQRCLSQGESLGRWGSKIAYDTNGPVTGSVREFLWNFLVPLAAGDLELDEELLETLPPNRLSVLTIHQAKGLEYPMVIVDIGSWIKDGHAHPALRYPDRDPDKPNLLARELGPFARYVDEWRTERDARFDDLVRKYFVAASRARQMLLLVAHRGGIAKGTSNVAAWTRRDEEQSLGPRTSFTVTLQ